MKKKRADLQDFTARLETTPNTELYPSSTLIQNVGGLKKIFKIITCRYVPFKNIQSANVGISIMSLRHPDIVQLVVAQLQEKEVRDLRGIFLMSKAPFFLINKVQPTCGMGSGIFKVGGNDPKTLLPASDDSYYRNQGLTWYKVMFYVLRPGRRTQNI